MSSVSSSGASRIVTPTERLLAVGKIGEDNSGDAVRPAAEAQDPDSDVPPPTDEVIITADAMDAAAVDALLDSNAEADRVASRIIDAVSETIPLVPAAYNGTPASQAAYAYAQTMQAWLESKNTRPASPRRPTKPKADTER
jgi:hypothetical protein